MQVAGAARDSRSGREAEAVAEGRREDVRLKKGKDEKFAMLRVSCLVSPAGCVPALEPPLFVSIVIPLSSAILHRLVRRCYELSVALGSSSLTSVLVAQVEDTALVGATRGDAHGGRAARGVRQAKKKVFGVRRKGISAKGEAWKPVVVRCVGLEMAETRNGGDGEKGTRPACSRKAC